MTRRILDGIRRIGANRLGWLCSSLVLASWVTLVPRVDAAETDTPERTSPRTWHATTLVSGRRGYRMIHYWSKGGNMRAETLIAGHPFTTIVRGDRYIAIDGLRGVGIDVGRSALARAEDAKRLRPFANDFEELRRAGAEKVEDTRAAGVPAELWRTTSAEERRSLWVSRKEPRVPIRFEIFFRGSAETIRTEYTNWDFDLEIPNRFFDTPQGIELERYDYEGFIAKSLEGPVGSVPVLYPDLLHGGPPP